MATVSASRIARQPEAVVVDARPKFNAHLEVARLAALHDEAREVLVLTKLLQRVPLSIAVLSGCALATVALNFSRAHLATTAIWLLLVAAGLGAIAQAFRDANAGPFTRDCLRAFAARLNLLTVYTGFAWGSGAYLVLSHAISPGGIVLFATGSAILFGLAIRGREVALAFLTPLATLSAFAAVLLPLHDATLSSALVVIASTIVGAAWFTIPGLFAPAKRPESPANRSIA